MKPISQSTILFIKEHRNDNPAALALSKCAADVDLPFALTQIAGRRAAAQKIPSWADNDDIRYPKHLSMEQCSSEATALYKASLVGGGRLVDLTAGLGVDCWFMSRRFLSATYVERQQELCEIAEHNFGVLEQADEARERCTAAPQPTSSALHKTVMNVVNDDGVEYLGQMEHADWIFIDPARRNEHGGKTVLIADCEPDVAELEELLTSKADRVMVKLSPMLDAALAVSTLKHVVEVHIISVANECKELLLILDAKAEAAAGDVEIHCVNISQNGTDRFVFTREGESTAVCEHSASVERYLYEPNASVMKGGAFKSVAAAYLLKKLHVNSHLYTSDELWSDFPGRVFEVKCVCSLNKKELKSALGDITKANISVRNFPATVAELRKRIRLSDGGDVYLFATTLADGSHVLVRCSKLR